MCVSVLTASKLWLCSSLLMVVVAVKLLVCHAFRFFRRKFLNMRKQLLFSLQRINLFIHLYLREREREFQSISLFILLRRCSSLEPTDYAVHAIQI